MTALSSKQPDKIEQFAQGRFAHWLQRHQPHAVQEWKFEPNGYKTAPDFYLELDGRTFAVEVTAIMRHEEVDGKRKSELDNFFRFENFLKRVRQKATSVGILQGTYFVGLDAAIQSFDSIEGQIGEAIIDYIRTTQANERSQRQVIKVADTPVCDITKLGHRVAMISLSSSYGGWEAEIAPELCKVVQNAIREKEGKLAQVPTPHILILVDQFALAAPYVWTNCLTGFGAAENFHTIFVVSENYEYAIRTGEPSWPALDPSSELAQFGVPGMSE